MRTPNARFPEYHSSADNLEFVQPKNLAVSFSTYLSILNIVESNKKYLNQNPKCEPQLGKRGLYHKIDEYNDSKDFQLAMLWMLNLSDGKHTILDISKRSKMKFELIKEAADSLVKHGLLKEYIE